MPVERIGELGYSTGDPLHWKSFVTETTIAYLRCVCGQEPPRCHLDVCSYDHELGSYEVLCLKYPHGFAVPEEYVRKCEVVLGRLEDCMPWGDLDPINLEEELDNCGPAFEDTDDLCFVSTFAQKLVAALAVHEDLRDDIRTAIVPLQAALERLPHITKSFDSRMEVYFNEEDRKLLWSINLSEREFIVVLYEVLPADEALSFDQLRRYSVEVDDSEYTEEADEDEHDFYYDPGILANIQQITFTDHLTKTSVEQKLLNYIHLLEPGGQTTLDL